MIEGIEDILKSDLLQRYVIGDITTEERIKVDMLRIDSRQVRQRLKEIEFNIEQQHTAQALSPPPGSKKCVMKSLNPSQEELDVKTERSFGEIFNQAWIGIAASFLIGAAAVGLAMKSTNRVLKKENIQLVADYKVLSDECEAISMQYAFINAPSTTPIVLENISSGAYQAVVYWNESVKASYLKCLNLPKLKGSQTYQIWADVDNEMLSIGTFSKSEEFIALGYYDDAKSLNITVEPKGGSDHPTLSTLTASKVI